MLGIEAFANAIKEQKDAWEMARENYEIIKQMQEIEDIPFKLIRKHSKFCSICGNELKLNYEFHLPFCIKCRHKLTLVGCDSP